jgi:hypothetical protein
MEDVSRLRIWAQHPVEVRSAYVLTRSDVVDVTDTNPRFVVILHPDFDERSLCLVVENSRGRLSPVEGSSVENCT